MLTYPLSPEDGNKPVSYAILVSFPSEMDTEKRENYEIFLYHSDEITFYRLENVLSFFLQTILVPLHFLNLAVAIL